MVLTATGTGSSVGIADLVEWLWSITLGLVDSVILLLQPTIIAFLVDSGLLLDGQVPRLTDCPHGLLSGLGGRAFLQCLFEGQLLLVFSSCKLHTNWL